MPDKNFWDQLLHAPGEILTKSSDDPYKVYTPFWRSWYRKQKPTLPQSIEKLEGLSDAEIKHAQKAGAIALPSAKDLGYEWDYPLLVSPGEIAAREKLSRVLRSRYLLL